MEDNIKRLVSEVTRLNREAGVTIDANVVAYVACLQEVQKAWDEVTSGASMSTAAYEPALIAKLGQLLHKELIQKDNPDLATATIQVMMEVAFKKQIKAVEQELAEHQESADMLSRSICAVPLTRSTTVQAYEKLHKLIVEYVCVQSRQDRALADEAAGDEVRAAVDSVFPLSSLARFLTLDEAERLNQISELARITLGISLYNRHCGTGGLALPPDTQSYMPQAQRLQRDLVRHASALLSDLQALAAFQGAPEAPGADPELAKAARLRAGKEAVNVAQCLATFQQLSADLTAGLDAAHQLEDEIQHLLGAVTEEVGTHSAVQKDVIFPLFDRLGEIHMLLGHELRMLVVRQRLYEDACAMLGGFASVLPPKQDPSKPRMPKSKAAASPLAASLAVPSAAEQAARELADSHLDPASAAPALPEGYEYVEPTAEPATSAEQRLQVLQSLSLSGMCPVALSSGGLLVPAKPSLGFVRVAASGQLLGVSSSSALAALAADPAGVLAGLDKEILQRPLLGKLLGRGSELSPMLDTLKVVDVMSGPLKVDFGCQTPVHFVERFIDYSYEWNQWALRRRALALANLRQKKTHSTQTALTHFKRDGDTQVWLPKEATVQTKVNKGQSMPKKLQYVAGLRGKPNTKMNVIRLELDLGQPHQY